MFFSFWKSHDQCYQNKQLRLWFEDITILYSVGTWNPQKVRIQNDPSSFETWHGMYTMTLESEDEVGIPGIFKVKKADHFSGSLDSWAGWPYPYWQVLENSSYAARAKELQGMMLKTKGAEAPFHQWTPGKNPWNFLEINGNVWIFWILKIWSVSSFKLKIFHFQDWQMIRFSQNEGRIKKYMGVSKNRGTPKWNVYTGKPY